ncbi:hypothetical protein B0A49_10217 [Cryomyces minteri]|uniref:Uncharacterized protein n=1 Tax=Cryomyces minteri TaxID=331657 RepID=A0A4U0WTC9_9PEZI|nr:hypothetical protein B0A49_10217 [Cryomyces minteri]
MHELLEPYKQYDAKLREIFAQEPDHPATANHQISTVPVFAGHEQEVKIRARNLLSETDEEKEQYIMPLKNTARKPTGSPAIVQSFKEFQTNFNLFCESSLVDMDWSNVLAAGSSVVTSLLPVPEQYNERAEEGFDKLTSGWLGARIDLVIHCAVMSKQNENTPRLLEYLIRRVPSSLNARSSDGYTPLHLAYSLLYRLPAAKQLIEAGADQTCRDYKGNNLLHALLCGIRNDPRVKPQGLRRMLSLLDPRLRESLATERSSADPGSTTPLARWMYLFNDSDHSSYHGRYGRRHHLTHAQYNNSNDAERADVLALLLSFSADAGNSELEMLNGEGDTPLHVAVRYSLPNFAKLISQKKPALLFRENAVGRTPIEIAQDSFLSAERFANPPSLPHPRNSSNAITARAPESFVHNELKDVKSDREKVYAVCTEVRQEMWGNNANDVGPKRKLVSLFEANEIAKRLASKKSGRDHVQKTESKQAGQERQEEEGSAKDEVEAWYGTGY